MVEETKSQIQQFYENQTILITGGTGFLGKLLIEKLLRSTSIKNIFVLVREKKGISAQDRLNHLLNDVLFDRLKNERPNFAQHISAIRGDAMLENFGLKHKDVEMLSETVNIVFHVAATVRFNEDLRRAYLINICATRDLIKLCKRMQQLKSIVHVSTAYSHCYRKNIDECFYDLPYDFNQITNLIENHQEISIEQKTKEIIGEWPNTYTFTKALAEDLIRQEINDNLPIGIFRPAIVISTYKEPLPGWIDNMYGPNGIVASALRGFVRIFPVDDCVSDVIPADYCVSGLIAVAWDIANRNKLSNEPPPIYNYVSSPDNPITWDEFVCLCRLNGSKNPSNKALWRPMYITVTNTSIKYQLLEKVLHIIPGCLLDFISILCLQKPQGLKTYQYIRRVSTILANFTLYDWQFTNYNMKGLLEKMNDKDKELFECNIANLSWLIYFRRYMKGVRTYLLNDPLETLENGKTKLWWLNNAHALLKFVFNVFIFLMIQFVLGKIFF